MPGYFPSVVATDHNSVDTCKKMAYVGMSFHQITGPRAYNIPNFWWSSPIKASSKAGNVALARRLRHTAEHCIKHSSYDSEKAQGE